MKPGDFLREIAWPLTDLTVFLAIVTFAILSTVASAAGMLGIWLAIVLVPAVYRYLLGLLEARACGRSAPVAGAELFSIVENFWCLTPFILYAVSIWGCFFLEAEVSVAASWTFAFAGLAILPASLAVLAVTRSPLESLNPAAWWRLIRACGPDYAVLLLVLLLFSLLLVLIPWSSLPSVMRFALGYYELSLMFTLTGAVLHANGVTFVPKMPAAVEESRESVAETRDRERQTVLNHAYGFVSRGNMDGGLAHIASAIAKEADQGAAYRWYFERMLKWEQPEAALFFARSWLGWLMAEKREIEALKLMTRCLGENPAFKPLPADRAAAANLAERFRRDDLLKSLA